MFTETGDDNGAAILADGEVNRHAVSRTMTSAQGDMHAAAQQFSVMDGVVVRSELFLLGVGKLEGDRQADLKLPEIL